MLIQRLVLTLCCLLFFAPAAMRGTPGGKGASSGPTLVLGAGGHTVAGPARFRGNDHNKERALFLTEIAGTYCVTLDNAGGSAEVEVSFLTETPHLEQGSDGPTTNGQAVFAAGEAHTACHEANKITARCSTRESSDYPRKRGKIRCDYRWRVDRNSPGPDDLTAGDGRFLRGWCCQRKVQGSDGVKYEGCNHQLFQRGCTDNLWLTGNWKCVGKTCRDTVAGDDVIGLPPG